MKKNSIDHWIVGIGPEDHCYTINGVKYVVSSRYAPTKIRGKWEPTLSNRIASFIGSGFANLTISEQTNMISEEYACSAAGEED